MTVGAAIPGKVSRCVLSGFLDGVSNDGRCCGLKVFGLEKPVTRGPEEKLPNTFKFVLRMSQLLEVLSLCGA